MLTLNVSAQASMAATVAHVFDEAHANTSPTELAGMYVLAADMGMVPPFSATQIVASLAVRYM